MRYGRFVSALNLHWRTLIYGKGLGTNDGICLSQPRDALELTLTMYPTLIRYGIGKNFRQIVYHVRPPEAAFPCSSRGMVHDSTLNLNSVMWAVGRWAIRLSGTKSISIKISTVSLFSDLASVLTTLGTSATRIHTRIEVNSP